MPQAITNSASITAIHTTVGSVLRCIDDDIDNFGGNEAQIRRIKKTIGLDKRRVVDQNTTTLDLCEDAFAKIRTEQKIDGLIFVTQTPDHFQPCNAAILHGRLNLPIDCIAFDINLGCSGWVNGLYVASLMIESGGCQRIVLAAGDTLSRCVHPQDRSVASLFGDAGSITILEKVPTQNKTWFTNYTDGKGWDNICIPAGAFRQPANESMEAVQDDEGNTRAPTNLKMNGAEVFNFSIQREPESIRHMLEFSQMTTESIDAFVFHQANRYIIGNIARRLKIPLDKVPLATVEKFGNQSSASIPATICDAFGDLLCQEQREMIFSGFGVGLSWATALTTIGNLRHCEVSIYGE